MRILVIMWGSEAYLYDSVEEFSEDAHNNGWNDGSDMEIFNLEGLTPLKIEFVPATVRIEGLTDEPAADEPAANDLPLQDMTSVLEILERRRPEGYQGHHSYVNGQSIIVLGDCPNDYYTERLPTIPAGTNITLDFGGDFGVYGVAEIGGVLHKIKVELHDLHRLDWRPLMHL